MEITLSLPDVLAAKLQTEARTQHRSTEDVAVELLDQALGAEPSEDEDFPLTLEEVVAKIRALPPNPANQFDWEAARKGLSEYLAASMGRTFCFSERTSLAAPMTSVKR